MKDIDETEDNCMKQCVLHYDFIYRDNPDMILTGFGYFKGLVESSRKLSSITAVSNASVTLPAKMSRSN